MPPHLSLGTELNPTAPLSASSRTALWVTLDIVSQRDGTLDRTLNKSRTLLLFYKDFYASHNRTLLHGLGSAHLSSLLLVHLRVLSDLLFSSLPLRYVFFLTASRL